jgi:hypothetical protein
LSVGRNMSCRSFLARHDFLQKQRMIIRIVKTKLV